MIFFFLWGFGLVVLCVEMAWFGWCGCWKVLFFLFLASLVGFETCVNCSFVRFLLDIGRSVNCFVEVLLVLVMDLLGFVCMFELFVYFDCVLMHWLEFSVCVCLFNVHKGDSWWVGVLLFLVSYNGGLVECIGRLCMREKECCQFCF